MPSTKPGIWSIALGIAVCVFYWVLKFFSSEMLYIPSICLIISGIGTFFSGVFSVVWSRERGILVFLAIAWGLLVLVFLIGSFFFPYGF
jgi:hypothetical protein